MVSRMAMAVLLAALVVVALPVVADDGDAILGVWLNEPGSPDGQGRVEIRKEGDRYFGRIVWLEIPKYPADDPQGMGGQKKVDRNNPDPKLRAVPTLGLEILKDFVYAGDGLWHKGTIYDPENGKTYKCKVRLTDEGILKVRGFIGISLIGRTTEWTPVTAEDLAASPNMYPPSSE